MMPNPLRSLLERFIQRVVARLFATTLDTLGLECEVEQKRRLEELARRYEADGMPDLAAEVRERLCGRTDVEALSTGEALLQQFAEPAAPGLADSANGESPRRLTNTKPARDRKPRKKKAAKPASPSVNDSDSPASPSDAFFPLDSPSDCQPGCQEGG